MKFYLKLLLIVLFIPFSIVSAQTNLDTISLNKDLSATLEFDNDINFIVLGNNPVVSTTNDGMPIYKYYDIFQDGNIVIFRVKSNDAPFTTLDVKLSNGILYHGYITQSSNVLKTLYSFKSNEALQEKKIQLELDSTKKADIDIESKFNKMKTMKVDFEDIALINNGVTFQVTNMVNDKQFMYFKVLMKNNTSNLYEVDGVTFKMTEGKKKSVKKKEIANQNWLSPVKTFFPDKKQIKAYSQDYIYFVVPMYSISTGNLTIKIIEKNGNRTGDIKISSEYLNKSKIFN